MRLVIIDAFGVIHEVTEDLEEYDLTKAMARSEIADNVHSAIERIKGTYGPIG